MNTIITAIARLCARVQIGKKVRMCVTAVTLSAAITAVMTVAFAADDSGEKTHEIKGFQTQLIEGWTLHINDKLRAELPRKPTSHLGFYANN